MFRYIATIRNEEDSKTASVEDWGQISDLFAPVKFSGEMDEMSEQFYVSGVGLNHWYTFDGRKLDGLRDLEVGGKEARQ